MMTKYSNKERKGLPGGPNEMFSYTTGVFSQTPSWFSNGPSMFAQTGTETKKYLPKAQQGIPFEDVYFTGDNDPFEKRNPREVLNKLNLNSLHPGRETYTDANIEAQRQEALDWINSPGFLKVAGKSYSNPELEQRKRAATVKNTPYELVDKIGNKRGFVNGLYDWDEQKILLENSGYKGIPLEEFNHSSVYDGEKIRLSTRELNGINRSIKDGVSDYYKDPAEVQNRVMLLRKVLKDNNVYDYNKDTFNTIHLKKLKEEINKHPEKFKYGQIKDLLKSVKTDADLIWLMNNLTSIEEDDGTRMAQKGIETKKYLQRAQRGGIMYDEEGMPMFDGNNSTAKKTVPPRKGVRKNPDGSHSTHLMAAETFDGKNWVVFPTLFQNPDGSWIDMSNEPREKAFQEAEKRGEVIDFGTDKDSALNFGKGSWKKEKPRRDNIGGISFEDEYTSTEGYKRNSPDRFNPYNIIPSGNITMEDVDFPILGIDNYGNEQVMTPGGNYTFPGDTVLEFPIAQRGAETGSYDYSKNLDFETMSQYANEVGMPYAWRQFNDAEKALYRKVMRQFNFKGQPVDAYNPNGVNAEYYTDAEGNEYIQSAPIVDVKSTPIDTGVYIKEWNDSNESRPKNKGMAADWDKRRDEYVVSRILEDNPTLLERDVEAMNKLSTNAQKFLATDPRFQQSYWSDMLDGTSALGAAGNLAYLAEHHPMQLSGLGSVTGVNMPLFWESNEPVPQPKSISEQRIPQIQNDPNKTDYEKQQLINMYEQAPGAAAFVEVLAGTEAPVQMLYGLGKAAYDPNLTMDQVLEGKKDYDLTAGEELAMDAGYEAAMFLGTGGLGTLAKGIGKGITRKLAKRAINKEIGVKNAQKLFKALDKKPKLKELILDNEEVQGYLLDYSHMPELLNLLDDVENKEDLLKKVKLIYDINRKFSNHNISNRLETIINLDKHFKSLGYKIEDFENDLQVLAHLGGSLQKDPDTFKKILIAGKDNKKEFIEFIKLEGEHLAHSSSALNNKSELKYDEKLNAFIKYYDKLKDFNRYDKQSFIYRFTKADAAGITVDFTKLSKDELHTFDFSDIEYLKNIPKKYKNSSDITKFFKFDNFRFITQLEKYTDSKEKAFQILTNVDDEYLSTLTKRVNDLNKYNSLSPIIKKLYKDNNDILGAINKTENILNENPFFTQNFFKSSKFHVFFENIIKNSTDVNEALKTLKSNDFLFNFTKQFELVSKYFNDFNELIDFYKANPETFKAINAEFINAYDMDDVMKILKNDKEAIKKIANNIGITDINDLEKVRALDLIDVKSLGRKFPNNPILWGGNVEYKKQLLEEAQNTAKDRALKQIEDTDLDFNYEAVQKEIDAINDDDYITDQFKDVEKGFYSRSEAEGTDPFVTEYTDDGYISADSWVKWAREYNPVFNEGFNDIAAIKANIPEYRAIEMREKANGTWMKNSDGSDFSGSPEMFVQQRSSAFQKAYPEDKLLTQKRVKDLIKEKEDPEFIKESESYIPSLNPNLKKLRWNDRAKEGINTGSTEPLLGVHSNGAPLNLFTFFDETKEGKIGAMFGPGQYTAASTFTPVTPIPDYLKDIPKELWPQKYRYGIPNNEEITDTRNHTYLYGPKRIAFYQDIENPLLSRGRTPVTSGNPNLFHPDIIKEQMYSIDDTRFRNLKGYEEFINSLPKGLTDAEIKEAVSKRYRQELTESLTPIVQFPIGTGRASGPYLPGEIVTPYDRPLKSALGNSGLFDRSNMWRNEKGAFYRALVPAAIGAGALQMFNDSYEEQSSRPPSERIGLPTYQQRGETPKYDFNELAERLNASYDPQYGWDYSVLTKDELKFYTDYYNKNIRKVDGESATGNSSRIDITQSEPETDLLYNTNQIQNLPLVTVTATRLKAAKHAADYEKKNPKPKRKQTLESTNWRKAMGLKDYDLIEWEKDRNRYVANQVAEDTGITERDVEAMNQITPLEEEYLLTQNKYQPSLYQDFTEGLETIGTGLSSLSNPYLAAQPFSQRRATQIMNSDNLTEREKQSKAAGYLSNPGISAVGDAMGVLSPLDVGVKALQAPFVDDYTIGDALSGTRNDVNPAIDMLMGTVTGAAGAKLAGKMARNISKSINSSPLIKEVDNFKPDLISQSDAVKARAERMLSQQNKWREQNNIELQNQFENAANNHVSDMTAQDFNIAYNKNASPSNLGMQLDGKTFVYKDAPLTEANKARVAAHETGHFYRNAQNEADEWVNLFDFSGLNHRTKTYLRGKGLTGRGKIKADEIRERAAQLKDYIAQKNNIPLNEDFIITQAQLDDAIKNYVKDTGLDNQMTPFLNSIKDKEGLLKMMNKSALTVPPAIIGTGIYLQSQRDDGYQEGGSVDTFRGSIYDQPIGTSRRMLKQRGGEVKLFKYQQPFKGTTYTSPYDIF